MPQELKVKVFQYDELSDKAKEKACGDHYDINVSDSDWNEFCFMDFKERLKKIGISCNTFYYDLDRGAYIYMDKPSVDDERLFMKKAGIDLRTKDARDVGVNSYIGIATRYYGGESATNHVEATTIEMEGKLQDLLSGLLNEFLFELRKEYEYMTSKAMVEDTIKANEYTFRENGVMFNG